ncbi:SixA phosphatase family protein [Agarivorans gilvus]|uniref:Phosphohistidine phosphatase n=1 Tax=Agarivorans gilvus TaxID=680279 RepID=A0ABQ1HYZ1_9ALTE|nr:histidine phosphatase family protein [Agarivorans gilvus]GGA97646.1 phosphohistidine phosphatase [Agarivorans gilvus]
MAKTLCLIRHGKSRWDQPHLNDRQRSLAPRGQAAASLMARHHAPEFARLQLVHYSPAARCEQTLQYWLAQRQANLDSALELDLKVLSEENLYSFSWADLLLHIQGLPEAYSKVALVGHNPALLELVEYLTGQDLVKFPTASIAVLRSPKAWSAFGQHCVQLELFDTPKRLAVRLDSSL